MIVSREAPGPILRTVSAAAQFSDLCIASLRADLLNVFLMVCSS